MGYWIAPWILLLICRFAPGNQDPVFNTRFQETEVTFACDLIVGAGNDTSVCVPGGQINLHGSVTGTTVFHVWTPSSGLNDPFILTPTADISAPVTFTLSAYGIDPANQNLIFNSDFELGNVGFTSDYTYISDVTGIQDELYPDSLYTIIDDPNLVNDKWPICMDHSSGAGVNMMLINGANGNPANDTAWCQVITIFPDRYYSFTCWIASMDSIAPPVLFASFNGQNFPLNNADSTLCSWQQNFPTNWYSDTATMVEICIINMDNWQGQDGTDYALDDISLIELCEVQDSVHISVIDDTPTPPLFDGPDVICKSDTGTYSASFPSGGSNIISYTWSVPSSGTLLNGQGTDSIDVLWNGSGNTVVCLTIETLCHNITSCYDVLVDDLSPFAAITGPLFLCNDEFAFYSVPMHPSVDEYNWNITSNVNIISGQGTNLLQIQWDDQPQAVLCIEMVNECGTTISCLTITQFDGFVTLIDTALCEGNTIIINGTEYGNGIWSGTEFFTSVSGCDSVVEIKVTEAHAYNLMLTRGICEGDSIFLQGMFQDQPGIYFDTFLTASGCDSFLITEVIFAPIDTNWITTTTCDPALAGTTITTYDVGNCDSTVVSEVVLLDSDTITVNLFSCILADTIQTIQLLSNHAGCDSLVITNTFPLPSETTLFYSTTCDPSGAGITTQNLTNIHGCDSLVISTVTYALSDTTLLTTLTCTYADTGITSTLYINSMGCDSLVMITMIYAGSDTTYLFDNTCIPSDAGLFITHLTNQIGCDSTISTFVSLLPSDTISLTTTTCEPSETGVSSQLLTNRFGCDSLIVTTTMLDPASICELLATFTLQQAACFGDTAWLSIDITSGLGPFELILLYDDNPIVRNFPGLGSYQYPIEMNRQIPVNIRLNSSNGLSIFDSLDLELPDPLDIIAETDIYYNGYCVPCYGDSLGEAWVKINDHGTPPLTFAWSNGIDSTHQLNLPAGTYVVTVTDSHGCESSSSVIITEPPLMDYDFNVQDIYCTNQPWGSVDLTTIEGGVFPWTTSLNGDSFQMEYIYEGLSPGSHSLLIMDQNGCLREEQFILSEPAVWSLHLGSDTMIAFGETFEISPKVYGLPNGALQYAWSDLQCDDCATRVIEASIDDVYSVTATDENGCTSVDEMKIHVFYNHDIYIPNIFSPDGDGINDQILISSGKSIKEIEELSVFDRWGNLVFQKLHFQTNDPSVSWNGMLNGKALSQGVYAYKVIVVYEDTGPETQFGDITLIR
ncbi:MAG TPA: gliding motility-associated C-terminal domain-containing protein [Saprospiraceae bacterium]|nr:gliding motility-associated C-terminal domain-containing protein [Saprospiraceae bacterium]